MASIKLNAQQAHVLTSISHSYASVGYWIRQMEDTVKLARDSFDMRTNLPYGGSSMMEFNAFAYRLRGEMDIAYAVFESSVHESHVPAIIRVAQQTEGFPQTFHVNDTINYKA